MKELAHQMCDFINASPSPYHCVQSVERELKAHGLMKVKRSGDFLAARAANGYLVDGGTLIAWRRGTDDLRQAGFRILGAHTDSPNLRLKPRPLRRQGEAILANTEPYGGVLLYSWFDRDLGLAGRIFIENDSGIEQRLVCIDRNIAYIPSLAIHLNRTVNKEGFKPNPHQHLSALLSVSQDTHAQNNGLDHIFRELVGVDESCSIVGHDLMFFDRNQACVGGVEDDVVHAARLDNQASCFQALHAFLNTQAASSTQVLAFLDHEEIGSRSSSGAAGNLMRDTLRRIAEGNNVRSFDAFAATCAQSRMVSLDMAHGVHANYMDKHDGVHLPRLNKGPVIKTHQEQRYATNGDTGAWFRSQCQRAGVTPQEFSIRADLACGSTIGPMSAANLTIDTVDVGCAMLSMHSARETCGAKDIGEMVNVLEAVLVS